MDDEQNGVRLLAARGWSRSGSSVMRSREGVPELVELYLWEWRREQWLPHHHLQPILERAQSPTGRRWWLLGPADEIGPSTAVRHARQQPRPRPTIEPPPSPPSWTTPDRGFLAGLPTGPAALLERLLTAHPPTRFLGALDQLARVLARGRYPTTVVHALVEAVTTRDEVTIAHDVPDLWGRPCYALRHELHGKVHDLLLDATGTCYRGYREIAGAQPPGPVAPGTLLRTDVLTTRDDIAAGHTPPDLEHSPDPVNVT